MRSECVGLSLLLVVLLASDVNAQFRLDTIDSTKSDEQVMQPVRDQFRVSIGIGSRLSHRDDQAISLAAFAAYQYDHHLFTASLI